MSVADIDVTVHEAVTELLAGYACYALDDDDDIDLVDAHLEVCAVCRAVLDQHLAVLGTLVEPDEMPGDHVWLGIAIATGGLDDNTVVDNSFAVMDPDGFDAAAETVWTKIMSALHEDVPLKPDEIVLTKRWIRFFVVSTIAAAVMLFVLIAAQDASLSDVRQVNEVESARLAAIDATLDPAAQIVDFVPVSGNSDVTVGSDDAPLTVVLLDGQGWLVRSRLAVPDVGSYQLWFDDDGTLTPVQVLEVDQATTGFDYPGEMDALVVTLEGDDGSTTPVARAELNATP